MSLSSDGAGNDSRQGSNPDRRNDAPDFSPEKPPPVPPRDRQRSPSPSSSRNTPRSIDDRMTNSPRLAAYARSEDPNGRLAAVDAALSAANIREDEEGTTRPNRIFSTVTSTEALDYLQDRHTQSQLACLLAVSHDGVELQELHDRGFKNCVTYKRGKGAMPEAVKYRVQSHWPTFITQMNSDGNSVPGIPAEFDYNAVNIDIIDFPIKFANPLMVTICTNSFSNPATQQYARIALNFFLNRIFTDTFILMANDVAFSFAVSAPQVLRADMVAAPIAKDPVSRAQMALPDNLVGDSLAILKNQRDICIASGTENLAWLDDSMNLRPEFGIMTNKSTRIELTFECVPLLADQQGNLNMNQWPRFLFCLVLYKDRSGLVKEGHNIVPLQYSNLPQVNGMPMCPHCLKDNCLRGTCPFEFHCKMCWKMVAPETSTKQHLLQDCETVKALKLIVPEIIPSRTTPAPAGPSVPVASSPASAAHTVSILGKRSATGMIPQNRQPREEYLRARQQKRNATRGRNVNGDAASFHREKIRKASEEANKGAAGPSRPSNHI